MLIDIAIVPTFSQEAAPPKGFTLRQVDASSTSVRALCDTVYAHFTARSPGEADGAYRETTEKISRSSPVLPNELEHHTAEVTTHIDGVDLYLTAGGVTLISSDAAVLADLRSVASAIDAHARRPVLPNRTSRPQPPSRPLITVHVTEKPEPYLINLNCVVLETKAPVTVWLPLTATIGDLRRACVVETGISDEDLMVLPTRLRQNEFNNPDLTLAQCELQSGDLLYLDVRSRALPSLSQFFVKTLAGRSIEIWLPLNSLVEDVKDALVPATGLETDAMRLIYAGKQLEEQRSLIEYNITAEATFHLVQRLRGNGHCGIPHNDDALLPMSFTVDDVHVAQRGTVVVKVLDTVGTIPFVQNNDTVTLARPCLGSPHVWYVSSPEKRAEELRYMYDEEQQETDAEEEEEAEEEEAEQAAEEDDEEEDSQIRLDANTSAEGVCTQVTAYRSATIVIHPLKRRDAGDKDGRGEMEVDDANTVDEEDVELNFEDCQTGAEFLQTLFAQVARKLPLPIKERGFDLYIVRPSGAEVLLDGVAPLLSPLNAQDRLIVRPVAVGTQPAFEQDHLTSSDSSDGGLA